MNNTLIVGAHYDDAELGVGGTAAKLICQGVNVYKITLTDTKVISQDMNLHITGEKSRQNSSDACRVIGGVREIEFPQQPYGNLQYSQKVMQRLEHVVSEYQIDTVFFHFADDYQTDHIAAHQICKTAFRHVKNMFMFQSNPYILVENYTPNYFVDISDYVEVKRNALKCYDKEHNRQGRLFETNIQRNAIWGYGNHCEYAEGFIVIKMCI